MEKTFSIRLSLILFKILFSKKFRALLSFLFISIPGPLAKEFIKRMLAMAKYANYQSQSTTFEKLKNQYPPNTKFVVLPMDMEYMKAGKKSL